MLRAHLTSLGSYLSTPFEFFTSIFFRRKEYVLKEKAVSFYVTFFISIILRGISIGVFNFWNSRMDIYVAKLMKVRIRLWPSCFFYYVNVNWLQAQDCNFFKIETLAQVFSCEFSKFLRTPFLTDHLQWLPLFTSPFERYDDVCDKKGLLIFRKFLLLENSFPSETFVKWCFALFVLRFVQRFLCFL